MYRARTVPRGLMATPGRISVTAVRSWITAPARSAAMARPRASAAGCTRAQWAKNRAPSTPSMATRLAVCPASSSMLSSGPTPHVRSCSTAARTRSSSQRCLRDLQRASLDEVALDGLALDDCSHLGDRPGDRAPKGEHGISSAALGPGLLRSGQLPENPAAVPTRGTVARSLGLEDDDLARGVRTPQLIGCPQSGESGADDAHIGLPEAIERGRAGSKGESWASQWETAAYSGRGPAVALSSPIAMDRFAGIHQAARSGRRPSPFPTAVAGARRPRRPSCGLSRPSRRVARASAS